MRRAEVWEVFLVPYSTSHIDTVSTCWKSNVNEKAFRHTLALVFHHNIRNGKMRHIKAVPKSFMLWHSPS